jgi:beta-lactamase class A
MRSMITRRDLILRGAMLVPFAVPPPRRASASGMAARLRDLERTSRGRLGVAVLDVKSGKHDGHRSGERFPMCSTFKVLAVAAVLARVDRGTERLDRRIPFGEGDLLEYAPVTRARVKDGAMSVADLCDAAITVSDNTAANLILSVVGGPAGVTAHLRSLGDRVTRLDRNEPLLNEGRPGDVRDTTTPEAMVRTLNTVLLGEALSSASRERLIAWLVATKTGGARLRAGLPSEWRVGDKTGSGNRGSTNDVAIVWPTGRSPLLIAVYLTETSAPADARDAVVADVARLVASTL